MLTVRGFAVFGKVFKNCAIARMKEKPPLGGNAATLVVHGKYLTDQKFLT